MVRKPVRPANAQQSKPLSNVHDKKDKDKKISRKSQSQNNTGLIPPSRILTYTLPPPNWPSTLPYLSSNHLSPHLSQTHHLQLSPQSPSSASIAVPTLATYTPTHNPLIRVQLISNPTHPAYNQHGLFAARSIPAGAHIVDYTGLVHICPLPSCATSDYDLAFLDRDAGLAIDSATMGNEGRFVNDWHGVRVQGPNAVFEEYFVKARSKGREVWEARMGVWACPANGIEKGSEICVAYGKGWWRARRGVMESDEVEVANRNVEAEIHET